LNPVSQKNQSMYRRQILFCLFFLSVAISLFAEETIPVEPMGSIRVYQPGKNLDRLIILISDADGWKDEIVDLAKGLAVNTTLVLGIDYNEYMDAVGKDRLQCACGDLGRLGIYVERLKGFKYHVPPILIGQYEGGEIVYSAMAQSPETFLGGVSLNFCTTHPNIRKMCKGFYMNFEKGKGIRFDKFLPSPEITSPWLVTAEPKCGTEDVKKFVQAIPKAQLLDPKNTNLDFYKKINTDWNNAYKGNQPNGIGLPAVEYPSSTGDTMVIILSGDGGWGSLDRDLGTYLNQKGVAVVGFDMLRYLWNSPTPEQGANDLARVVSYYVTKWNKKQALLVGYSMGADALAFMASGMNSDAVTKTQGLALIGPSIKSQFQLGFTDKKQMDLNVGDSLLPYFKKTHLPVLCIGGSVEKVSLCRRILNDVKAPKNFSVELLDSGHGFNNDYEAIAAAISKHFNIPLRN